MWSNSDAYLNSLVSVFFQVGKDDLESSKTPPVSSKAQLNHPLVNQYSLTLGQDLGQHDTKSLIKCVETLSFIVRDAAHVTPDNFELCVKAIRVFVEASLNGGETLKYILEFIGPDLKSHRVLTLLIQRSASDFLFKVRGPE